MKSTYGKDFCDRAVKNLKKVKKQKKPPHEQLEEQDKSEELKE